MVCRSTPLPRRLQGSSGLLSLFVFALMARMWPGSVVFGPRVLRRVCGRTRLRALAFHWRDLALPEGSTLGHPFCTFWRMFGWCVHWRCFLARGRCWVRPGRGAYRRRIGKMLAHARCPVHGWSGA